MMDVVSNFYTAENGFGLLCRYANYSKGLIAVISASQYSLGLEGIEVLCGVATASREGF